MSIIVVKHKNMVTTPRIKSKVFIVFVKELVIIVPNFWLLLILLLCIFKMAFFKDTLLFSLGHG